MFERFTDKAKAVVHGAQLEAQGGGASSVRSEHLVYRGGVVLAAILDWLR